MTLIEKLLEMIKDESIKSNIRQYTCVNSFGYSQFERNLAEKFLSICIDEIKSACDQQKELCLKAWGNAKMDDEAEAIANSPYPEGVE